MHRSPRLIALVTTALVAAFLAACGGGATPTPEPPSVSIEASEFAFKPDRISGTAGQTLTIELVNKGTIEHDFTIDTLNVKLLVGVGKTGQTTTPSLTAGTYDFYCAIPGHKEAGMVGTLEVK